MKILAWIVFWPVCLALSIVSAAYGVYYGTGGHKPVEGNIDFTYILVIPIGIVGCLIGCLVTALIVQDKCKLPGRLGYMILGSQIMPFLAAFVIYAFLGKS
jgi:hypothetical protein